MHNIPTKITNTSASSAEKKKLQFPFRHTRDFPPLKQWEENRREFNILKADHILICLL